MSSSSVSERSNQRPRLLVAPEPADTFGELAFDFAAAYGLTLDDWQRLVLDDWLSVDEHDLWSSLTCGLSCPRQNGKNAVLEVRELFGMVGRGEKILHTAHEVKTARKAFKRLQHFFGRSVGDRSAKFPELNARVTELRNVNGQEAIFLDNGGSVEIVARSKNSGRGFTADVLILDEAQEMSDEDLEALMPTTSAAPLGNPQWIFTGTPPGPKVNGEVFTRTRNDALGDTAYRVCWHEWSACDPGKLDMVDLDSLDVWTGTNPALGGRLLLSVVEGERARYSDEGFARERLGVWSDIDTTVTLIHPAWWAACLDVNHKAGRTLAYALDVSPEATSCAIAASDGVHSEVVKYADGTAWVVSACLAKRDRFDELVIDPAGPAGRFIPALEAEGIPVRQVSTREAVQACGSFLDGIANGTVRHIGQPELDRAVHNAGRRDVGDGGWMWSRKRSSVDISPLYAVTLAHWAAHFVQGPSTYEDRGLVSL